MGNRERNSYVTGLITEALVDLLATKELRDITVSELIDKAEVCRNSFYRNFADKEDVLRRHVSDLLSDWEEAYAEKATGLNSELYGSLFGHLKANSDFYMLLRQRGLFHLFCEEFIERWGAKPGMPNAQAYIVAFVAWGSYGWACEWMERGMEESAEEMAAMLTTIGIA